MKGFMRNLGRRDDRGLTNRVVQVGPYTVRVDALIGEGGFANIYRVQDQTTNQMYALKHVRMGGNPGAIADIKNEVDVMKAVRGHPCVLTLRAVVLNGPPGAEVEALLLLDLCTETLASCVSASPGNRLPEAAALAAFTAVAEAVAVMHAQQPPIAHRDLKAENVLRRIDGSWVLADYGSASRRSGVIEGADAIMMAEDDFRRSTTPAYRAPEMWDLYAREVVDYRVDLWALGCLLYLLVTGKLPFQAEAKLQILNGDYTLPESGNPGVINLIRDLLQVIPSDRPHITLVLHRIQKLQQATPPPQTHSQPQLQNQSQTQPRPPSRYDAHPAPPMSRGASASMDSDDDLDADLALALQLSEAEAAEGAMSSEQQRALQQRGRDREAQGRQRQEAQQAQHAQQAQQAQQQKQRQWPAGADLVSLSNRTGGVSEQQQQQQQQQLARGAELPGPFERVRVQAAAQLPPTGAGARGVGTTEGGEEVDNLRTRLTDATAKNKKLLGLVHQQHTQIQQLELQVYNQGTELKTLRATAAASERGSAGGNHAQSSASWVDFETKAGYSEGVAGATPEAFASVARGGSLQGGNQGDSLDGFSSAEFSFSGDAGFDAAITGVKAGFAPGLSNRSSSTPVAQSDSDWNPSDLRRTSASALGSRPQRDASRAEERPAWT